jgi:hypothetical protein
MKLDRNAQVLVPPNKPESEQLRGFDRERG